MTNDFAKVDLFALTMINEFDLSSTAAPIDKPPFIVSF
jgi:hypothetical protein